MGGLAWYWHRLRAMSPAEVAWRARQQLRQWRDARGPLPRPDLTWSPNLVFPRLLAPASAPSALRAVLQEEVTALAQGHFKAFGHLKLRLDDPPRWHRDYLAGVELETEASAFDLNHRCLPAGADIKLLWELSRWQSLVRMAQAAWVLGDSGAAGKCLDWLEDWVRRNPPYRGWNWTSALETGMRLIAFTWMDGLLEAAGHGRRLAPLRCALLPAHVAHAWRYRSFGSSANNHLLGELAGLMVASARWPEVGKVSAPFAVLQRDWEREVLAQFAPDGGHREQALHYHLYAWELCWLSRLAVCAAGRTPAPEVEQRLAQAAQFFCEVQGVREPWDYGDSDDAVALPCTLRFETGVREWQGWFRRHLGESALDYWLGDPPRLQRPPGVGAPSAARACGDWWHYPESGIALCESGFWWLRWDLSPLGYLRPAAHGHLDALHLSIWFHGVAVVIDPGTGAYYADPALREWLASRRAHNGPCPEALDWPRRRGPFLWSSHHEIPRLSADREAVVATWRLPQGLLSRTIRSAGGSEGWKVEDAWQPKPGGSRRFGVRWQFAPGALVRMSAPQRFVVKRRDITVEVVAEGAWDRVQLVYPEEVRRNSTAGAMEPEAFAAAGVVSPAFRQVAQAPFLELGGTAPVGGGDKPCLFRTTFIASPRS